MGSYSIITSVHLDLPLKLRGLKILKEKGTDLQG